MANIQTHAYRVYRLIHPQLGGLGWLSCGDFKTKEDAQTYCKLNPDLPGRLKIERVSLEVGMRAFRL